MSKDNPIKKERLNNLKKAKEFPLKKRIAYYLDFFKIPLLAFLAIAIVMIIFVKEVVLAPKTALNVTVIGRNFQTEDTSDEFINAYSEYANIDCDNEVIIYDPDFYIDDANPDTVMKLVAAVSANDQDIIICNEETYKLLCQMSLLYDLTYFDNNYADKYSSLWVAYDHTQNDTPDDDGLGIKEYGIDITESAVLKSYNFYGDDERIILAIGNGSKRFERTEAFIDWILD